MRRKITQWALSLFLAIGFANAFAVEVTFNVTVPTNTQKVYIIGSTDALGNWGANEGKAKLMTQTGPTDWRITINLSPNTVYQYMFLCGPNWKYEQSPNQNTQFTTGTVNNSGDNLRYNTVTAWTNIPPLSSTVTFKVVVPASTENVYLIGDDNDAATPTDELGAWQADKGWALKMTRVDATTFTLTKDLAYNKTYHYKYLAAASLDHEQWPAEPFSVSTSTAIVQTNDVVTAWKSAPSYPTVQNYLKRNGNQITDAKGNNFIIRAIGLGNYMVWEPYMWKVTDYGKAGIMQDIVGRMSLLLTPEHLQEFIDGYMANYITKADVDSLKAWGFNAIRLPMHYNLFIKKEADNNTFIEKGFEMTERLRQWCAANQMYLILDLHAAPGGQGNDKAIADCRTPALWDGDENGTAAQYQDKTVVLWGELARRFADKEWMGGYDLLNETNYGGGNLKLLELYKRCVNQIRRYDSHGIIYLEGNWFANDFSTITPNLWGADWDENMAYSCHKYWAAHDGFAGESVRSTYNVPLWLGETGENSNEWFYQTVKLAESRNIGWAWWAHKKIDNISGFTSIKESDSFKKISDFINNGTGLNPAQKEANKLVFDDFLEYVKLENCKINRDVLFSLIGQQADGTATKPYGNHTVPGVVHATDYDLGRQGYAFYENNSDQVLERTSSSAGAYNAGWTGRNDAVDFEKTSGATDPKSNGYNLAWTTAGEWVQYSVNAAQHGIYKVWVRHASQQSSVLALTNGTNVELFSKTIPATGGWQTWAKTELGQTELAQGLNKLRLAFKSASININYIEFELITPLAVNDKPTDAIAIIANDTVRFNAPTGQASASITDLNGRVCDRFEATGSYSIAHLPKGIYVLEVKNTQGTLECVKFVR